MSGSLLQQLNGYGLTTALILYRLPDFPKLFQEYVWQDYDVAPRFPELNKFLDFWKRELEGPLCEVKVAHRLLIRPAELRVVQTQFILN